jgi:hypothetical protein
LRRRLTGLTVRADAERWNRWAAERGEIHALQRRHAHPQSAGGELSICTIDPNLGVVTVPDPRLEVLAKLSHSQKIIRFA